MGNKPKYDQEDPSIKCWVYGPEFDKEHQIRMFRYEDEFRIEVIDIRKSGRVHAIRNVCKFLHSLWIFCDWFTHGKSYSDSHRLDNQFLILGFRSDRHVAAFLACSRLNEYLNT